VKRPKASRPVSDEGVNDDANVPVEIERDADEGFPIVQSSRRSGMTGRPNSTRVRHQSAKAAAAIASNSDDDASASRPGTSPPLSPKLATKPTRKKAPPKRQSKKETDSENTPTNKPAVLPAGVRRPPPVPGAKKGGDIDLNNLDEYNKLFGIAGGSSVCLFV